MKKKVFSLLAAGLAIGMTACNNSSNYSTASDSTATNTTTATTSTSSGNYAARADTVNTNVSAGNYLNPRTGKAYTKLNLDQSTGRLTDESGKPVRRYVDKRTWWVYDTNSWDTVGSAQMHNGSLMYRGNKGDWEQYDQRWNDDMDNTSMGNDSTSNMSNSSTSGSSTDKNNPKVKVSDKGNKVKIKNTDKKQ
ncbi:MAG: hypothetical protein ACJ75B_15600 [Flavisolibacter sp.]